MGTFLFTNILLLKEKKHGRAKSCSPMPKGSRHSSQRVPTLSGKYVSFFLHPSLLSSVVAYRAFFLHLFPYPIFSPTKERPSSCLACPFGVPLRSIHPPLRPYAFNYIPTHSGILTPFRVGQMSRVVAYIVISVNV